MLNTLWGFMGRNADRTQCKVLRSFEELLQFTEATDKIDQRFCPVSSHLALGTYRNAPWALPHEDKGSLLHAIVTTSYARLMLLRLLQTLGPDRVMYIDTDSTVFLAQPHETAESVLGDWMGSCLGQLSDELKGKVICQWVCADPKNYGYRAVKREWFDRNVRPYDGVGRESFRVGGSQTRQNIPGQASGDSAD